MQNEQGPTLSFDEVYAYLEAHFYEANRVQIVVEELLGMTNVEDDDSSSTSGSSGSRDQAEVKTVQEDEAQPPDDPSIPGPSQPQQLEAELDPSLSWELERHGQLVSMFPDLCPDYLTW